MHLKREAKLFGLAFIPHSNNNNREKAVLYAMLFVWVSLELGVAFAGIEPPGSIDWMRYLVLFIVGQMFGLERGRFREISEGKDQGESAENED